MADSFIPDNATQTTDSFTPEKKDSFVADVKGFAKDVWGSFKTMMKALPSYYDAANKQMLADYGPILLENKLMVPAGTISETTIVSNKVRQLQQESKVQRTKTDSFVADELQGRNKWAVAVGAGIPSFGAALAIGLITKNPAAAGNVLGASVYPLTYTEARQEGMSVATAIPIAAVDAYMEAKMETWGFDKLLGPAAKGPIKRVVSRFITESLQEGSEQLKSNVLKKLSYSPNMKLTEGVLESAFGGGILGLFASMPIDLANRLNASGLSKSEIDALQQKARELENREPDLSKINPDAYKTIDDRTLNNLDFSAITSPEDVMLQLQDDSIPVVHFSNTEGLTQLDPSKMGTGYPSEEKRYFNLIDANGNKFYMPRTHFYTKEAQIEPNVQAASKTQYTAKLSSKSILDVLGRDKAIWSELTQKAAQDPRIKDMYSTADGQVAGYAVRAAAEQLAMNRGYKGIKYGPHIQMFEAVNVTPETIQTDISKIEKIVQDVKAQDFTARLNERASELRTLNKTLTYGQSIGDQNIIQSAQSQINAIMEDVSKGVKPIGGTFNLDGSTFNNNRGYQIGVLGYNTDVSTMGINQLAKIFDVAKEVQKFHNNVKVGIYTMPNNQLAIDVSLYTNDKNLAVSLGQAFNQESIWDWSTQSTIKTGGTGESPAQTISDVEAILKETKNNYLSAKAQTIFENPITQAVIQLSKPNKAQDLLKSYYATETQTSPKKGAKNFKSKTFIETATMKTLSHALDGGDVGHYDQIRRAIRDRFALKKQIEEQIRTSYLTAIRDNLGNSFRDSVEGDPYKLNSLARMEIYMKLRNENSRNKLIRNGILQGSIGPYLDNPNFLTPAEQTVVDITQKTIDSVTQVYAKALLNFGIELQIEPYYSPISYEHFTGVPNSQESQLVEHIKDMMEGKKTPQQINLDRAKARQAMSFGKMKMDLMQTMDQYADDVSRVIAFADIAPQLMTELKYTLPIISEKFGPAMAEAYQKQIVTSVVGESKVDQGSALKVLNKLKQITYSTVMMARPLKLAMTQVASIFNTMDRVGPIATSKGLQLAETKEGWATAMADPIFKTRMMEIVQEDLIQVAKYGNKSLQQELSKTLDALRDNVLTVPNKYTDQRVAGAAYLAGYQQWLETHPGDTQGAVEYARDILEDTQGMSQIIFRSNFQQSSVGRFFSMFQTQQFAAYNYNLRNYIDKLNGLQSESEFAKHIIMSEIVPALYLATVDQIFRRGWESLFRLSKKDKEEYMKNMVTSAIQQIPIFGGWLAGMEYSKGKTTFPFTSPIDNTYKDLKTIGDRRKSVIEKIGTSLRTYLRLVHGFETKPFTEAYDFLERNLYL